MRLREGLVLRKIGDDHVIVDPGQGIVDLSKVYTLNDTAAWLWDKIKDQDFVLEDLIQIIQNEFEISSTEHDLVKKDMEGLISFFKENHLLQN